MDKFQSETDTPFFVVNVQVAVFCKNKILVIGRSQSETHAAGATDLPGGKLELSELGDEALERAARREVHEETGVSIDQAISYVCSSGFIADDGAPVINIVYYTTHSDENDIQLSSGSDEEFAIWEEINQVLSSNSVPSWTKSYIEQAQRKYSVKTQQ